VYRDYNDREMRGVLERARSMRNHGTEVVRLWGQGRRPWETCVEWEDLGSGSASVELEEDDPAS
jgi:hypothetical protein